MALQQEGFDLDLTGFSAEDLMGLLETPPGDGLTDPDDIPLPPDEAITQHGDLWLLGKHRLLCGDSSKPEDVDRLLAGQPIHLVDADPPYNVKVEPRSNNAIAAGLSSFQANPHADKSGERKLRARDRPLANDFVSDEEFDRLLRAWFGSTPVVQGDHPRNALESATGRPSPAPAKPTSAAWVPITPTIRQRICGPPILSAFTHPTHSGCMACTAM
jgi:hypothetical protein